MSLILLEGFDDGLRNQRWANNGMNAIESGARWGNKQPLRSNESMRYSFDLADQHATITVGCWLQQTQAASNIYTFFQLQSDSGTTTHVSLRIHPTGSVSFSGPSGAYESDIIWRGVEAHYFEFEVVLHDTAGSYRLWVDGVLLINVSDIDTKAGGTKTVFDAFRYAGGVFGSFWGYMSDVYITNGAGSSPYNGRLGDIIIETKFPDGNGFYSDFVGSDADSTDNYQHVDENPNHDGNATYVESGDDLDRDSYTFEDIALTTGNIRGVIATAVAKNTGAADYLQVSTRISSIDYDSATMAAPASYNAALVKVWQVSPATSSDWTIAEINAAEFGIENVV